MTDAGAATLLAGRVGRPHGLDGRLRVHEARPRLLVVGAEVDVGGTARLLEARGGTDEHPIVRLAGVGDRDAAEALRGAELRVPRAVAPDLEEDEHWLDDLVGLTARDRDGRTLGVVQRVLDLPSCAVLVVPRAGGELLVPLVRDAVPELDVPARRCVVDTRFLGVEDAADPDAAAPSAAGSRPGRGPDEDGNGAEPCRSTS